MNFNATSNFSDAKRFVETCQLYPVVHSWTSSYTWNMIAACVVNIVFCIAGTILNSLVLYIFWKSTKMRLKLSYFAIMLLSSVDLAVVTIVHSTFLLQAIHEINGTPNCAYKISYLFSLNFFTGMSIMTLLILNLERYAAIIHPFLHRTTATKRRLMFIWAILWLIVVVNTVFSFLNVRLVSTIMTLIVILTLCCTSLFTYISIFRIARRRKSITPCNALGHHANFGNCHGGKVWGNMASFLRELKMAKTYFIIVVLAFVCFLPVGIFSLIPKSIYAWSKTEIEVIEPIDIANIWMIMLTSMNSTLNCLIFFWGNKMLRREALKHMKKFFSK